MCDVCAAKQIDARIETYVSTRMANAAKNEFKGRKSSVQRKKEKKCEELNQKQTANRTHWHAPRTRIHHRNWWIQTDKQAFVY